MPWRRLERISPKVLEILQPPPDRRPWGVGGGGIDGVGRRQKRLAPLPPREGRLGAFPGDFEVDGFAPLKLLLKAGRLDPEYWVLPIGLALAP